jgi:DNA-binding NtrC family response regulator
LRDRRGDIRLLALHFLGKSAAKIGVPAPRMNREDIRQLEAYDWPGNVRELENVIERATILSKRTGRLELDIPGRTPRTHPREAPRRTESGKDKSDAAILTAAQLRERELESILAALRQAKGKVFGPGGAASILGMRPTTLASRMKTLGIKKTYRLDNGATE